MPIPPSLRTLLRTIPTLAPVSNRAVLSVSGSQAAEFLNGLLACSVQGKQTYGTFLHAQVRPSFECLTVYNRAVCGRRDASCMTPFCTTPRRHHFHLLGQHIS
jgi:folate-binding Fe-S cluster repair protein YgfZ